MQTVAEQTRPIPLTALISKSIRHDDLRLKQVGDVIEVPMMDRDARQLALPKSQMLKRELFTKTLDKKGT